jgi:hypothetical protein
MEPYDQVAFDAINKQKKGEHFSQELIHKKMVLGFGQRLRANPLFDSKGNERIFLH